MTHVVLRSAIQESGLDQQALYALLNNLTANVNELIGQVAALRTRGRYQPLGNPGFAIDTNFDVKNATAIYYTNGGTVKTLSANSNFDTGTAATIAGAKWKAALLSIDSAGTGTVTWGTGTNSTEAAALLLLPALPAATHTPVGYFTVLAHASGFTAGTDALTTGSGGNVATTTTYYNLLDPLGAVAVAAETAPALTAG